ncbi:MAG TPA: VIT1/CCC1 transporter family protein [archaeon]|nr:VIT1/CCC1 transporter family protein [archaeon]
MATKKKHFHHEKPGLGSEMRDVILGWQDGLVNVLGIVLAVAAASVSAKTIIIAGLAATFAESISMAAVAYTSTKTARDFYLRERETEKKEIREIPDEERREIRDIYFKKGFRGRQLKNIVKKLTSKKKLWLETMMSEELGLSKDGSRPVRSALIVGVAALIGSLFPLIPFFLLSPASAILPSLVLSVAVLFVLGSVKAKFTRGTWFKSGLEIAVIGLAAALIGYGIGTLLGVTII